MDGIKSSKTMMTTTNKDNMPEKLSGKFKHVKYKRKVKGRQWTVQEEK